MFIIKSLARFACAGTLIAVLAITAAFASLGETSESRELDNLDRTENSSSPLSSRLRVSSSLGKGSEEVDNNNVEDDEEAEETGHQEASNKTFSWKYHPDDHSIYSHRSLMSTLEIEHPDHAYEAAGSSPSPTVAGAGAATDGGHHSKADFDDADYEALRTSDYAEKEWNLMFRSFDGLSDGLASSMLHTIGKQTNLLEEVVSRLKPDCKRAINHIKDSVKKHKLWALRMVDANGKLPSGVTYGRFSSPGDYEECLAVSVDETVYGGSGSKVGLEGATGGGSKLSQEHHKFYGKYCLLDFRLPLPPRPHGRLLSIHEPVLNLSKTEFASTYPEVKNYSAYASVFYEIGYLHAICLPSTCDVVDLAESLGFALEGLHIIVNTTVDCEVKYEGQTVSWTKAQVISMTLMVLLFLNAATATIAHYLRTKQQLRQQHLSRFHHDHEKPTTSRGDDGATNKAAAATCDGGLVGKILHNRFYQDCFSVQKNFERLTKPDPRGLTFVHYTRIVAMALTVITHTAGMGTLQAITKPADAANSEQIFRDFLPQMLANAFSSIQIFFFMAGFMLVISTYPSIKRDKGHISFLEYVIKRAIRLMPGLAATIGLNFLWPLIVDGPMLTYFTRVIVEPCETNWWRTMAFLSNFDHVEKMCLRHSYFSASDYQLHVMAFPLLILLYKQPILSLAIAALLTLTGFVAQVIMVITKTVMPFMMVDYIDKEAFFNVVHYIHHPVWNHMSAFFYGFIMGYFVVKQIRVDLSPKTISRTWWILMPAGIASIFAPYFWNHYKRPIFRWQMIIYVIVDRLVLLTTCAWLAYASMVLARKPAAKKPVESPSAKQGNLNLPDIVTLNQTKGQREPSDMGPEEQAIPDDLAGEKSTNYKLTSGLSTTSIPRQRSSPNIMATETENDKPLGLRPAASTIDMSSVQSVSAVAAHLSPRQPSSPSSQDPLPMVKTQQQPRGRPQAAPVSNLNTLCLVLSRLTFQLYLFNMVVLWVDVNHSKYNWFFSYYFIITKALAVYIASSLMAMVFFVTLESPSLTLYIMWVKSRAQSRANRRTAREAPATGTNEPATTTTATTTTNITNIDVNFNPRDSNVSPDSLKQSKYGGGLHMRTGSPVGPTKPTFSFIDLSTPPTSASHTEAPSTINDNQTKM